MSLLQSPDLDHYASMHSRSASASPNSSSSLRASVYAQRPASSDDLYRSSFANGVSNGLHSRTPSTGSTHSGYSLSTNHLSTPNDSPPTTMDYSPGLASQQLKPLSSRQTGIRRARHESSNPYPRSSSFSGSDSVRSSSSEAEDIGGVFAFNPQQQPHQQSSVSGYSSMFARQPAPMDSNPATGAFQRMTLDSEEALEQLANNVRAATTTSASDRAKHIFVQAWLNANYAHYPDGNVPRQGLYNSYRRVCDEYRIPHVNTATLGKAIRLCFPAIKTRRLGVRGNSKYHYCGIRPATAAEAEWLQDFVKRTTNQRAISNSRPNSQSGRSSATDDSPEDDEDESEENSGSGGHNRIAHNLSIRGGGPSGRKSPTFSVDDKTPTVSGNLSAAQGSLPNGAYRGEAQIRRRSPPGSSNGSSSNQPTLVVSSNVPPHLRNTNGTSIMSQHSIRHPHSASASVRTLRNFPSIDEAIGQPSSSQQSPHGVAAREVWRWFEDHLDALLDCVRAYRFDQFESLLRGFWSGLGGEHREVVHAPAVAGLMARADAIVYDEILEILRSQLLTPIQPHTLTSLRQLADKMEKVLLLALENYGNTFVEPKVELGARFGHLVLRFLDIYQVTQALSSVMSNPKQLVDMSRSWREIDFESVRNQAALVCNCRHEDLHQLLEVDFVSVLDGLQASLEPVRDVMNWADTCCDRLMGANGGALGQEDRATMSSRSLLIRWGYVTSQIMRDLTIRSDPAFGAFQILKLFMDDWIALNVLRSVALSTNSVAASVEPVMQQQFLALSPGTSQFGSSLDPTHGSHQNSHSHQPMAHTPTTASMLASTLHDPFASSSSATQFPYDSLSFGQIDPSSSGASPGGGLLSGASAFGDFSTSASGGTVGGAGSAGQPFDFASHNMSLDVSTSGPQSSMTSSSTTGLDGATTDLASDTPAGLDSMNTDIVLPHIKAETA